MASALTKLSSVRAFSGYLNRYEHVSTALGSVTMKFAVFVPDAAKSASKIPTLYYLSGLTCTDENVSQKGAIAFKFLSEQGMAMVMPDTSPRGHPEIEGENESYDFGTGAGFYLNATKAPYSTNYKMYDYVVEELPALVQESFSWYTSDKVSITGHSMGGHGALTIGLKNGPSVYKSISAFAPIVNPMAVPWGEKAFAGYLEKPEEEAKMYDACELIKSGEYKHSNPILVDQGTGDNFYKGEVKQLQPEELKTVCEQNGQELILNMREDYDHSYWFISSFFEDHVRFHAKYLK